MLEIGTHFHVGPLAILRKLLDCKLTTLSFYKEKHKYWNKPNIAFSKNNEGRNIAKESITEKGKIYISLAFNAFDQNKIDIKELSDFLGVKISQIAQTLQLLKVL